MERTLVNGDDIVFPTAVRPYVDRRHLYDSSSSPQARVFASPIDGGYFIKTAPAGTLRREAKLTAYFHGKGLAAEVVHYGRDAALEIRSGETGVSRETRFHETGVSGDVGSHETGVSGDNLLENAVPEAAGAPSSPVSAGDGSASQREADWLVTRRVPGEDCVAARYMTDPKRLTDLLAERLRLLHDTDPKDCPIADRTAAYLAAARRNHRLGVADRSFFTTDYGDADTDRIYRIVEEQGGSLRTDTLLHGDYCLPNVILDDWRFSGFVDLDSGGVGDRHVDVFWALWTLRFNLHTDEYWNRFLDGYGRNLIDEDRLRVVAAVEVFG